VEFASLRGVRLALVKPKNILEAPEITCKIAIKCGQQMPGFNEFVRTQGIEKTKIKKYFVEPPTTSSGSC
jgi:hypothetical protein